MWTGQRRRHRIAPQSLSGHERMRDVTVGEIADVCGLLVRKRNVGVGYGG